MADIKITGLPALAATPDDADILEIVDDVAGTPTSKKITVANLKAAAPQGDVTAAANIDDNSIVVGDGGAKGVKKSVALSAQGDILYASAANVLARLAKGAANTKIFMNAGATAPEWAVGIKFGTFTRDTAIASGTQAISGVGFKPSHVIFMGGIHNSAQQSFGFDDGTLHYHVAAYDFINPDAWLDYTDGSLFFVQASGVSYLGSITTLGADGFTITWTKTGAKTGTATMFYMAFR